VGGTAYLDLAAVNAEGRPVSSAWPKLTSGWMVANPAIGGFGDIDRKVVVAMTRDGQVFAYRTDAPVCSPGSWPRFHHDNANSGVLERDAVLPGKPRDLAVADGALAFTAPGDDGVCGTATTYEVVQSDEPIDSGRVASLDSVAGAPAPAAAGTRQTLDLGAVSKRYVGIRAVDEQGNVGRVADIAIHGADSGGGNGGSGDGSQPGDPPPVPGLPPGPPGSTVVAGKTASGTAPPRRAHRTHKAKRKKHAKRKHRRKHRHKRKRR